MMGDTRCQSHSLWAGRRFLVMAPLHTVYPVLPLKSTVLFPHILMPVAVGRPQSGAGAEGALGAEDKMLVAAVQRDPQTQAPDLPALYHTATLAVVKRVIQ